MRFRFKMRIAMTYSSKRPLCIVISAPSGTGKTMLCERLLDEFHTMIYSISCTTRPSRKSEINGRDYVFLTESEFSRRIEAGDFLEYASVHGYWYGTLRQDVEKVLSDGLDVLMDIDIQGAKSIRNIISKSQGSILHKAFVDVFIVPPDMDELKKRIEQRKEDSAKVIRRRLKDAEQEMLYWKDYQYLIVNDDRDKAYDQLRSVIVAEHCKV